MEHSDTLTTLYRHNLWANLRLLEKCTALTDEQLDSTSVGTYGSIREILRHIARAERSYFSRISTGQQYQHPEGAPPMTLADMKESLRTTGSGFIEWALKVHADDTVAIDWEGSPRDVPKNIILTQVINHATEHREQIKAILTGLGIEPPDLSGWTYFEKMDQ